MYSLYIISSLAENSIQIMEDNFDFAKDLLKLLLSPSGEVRTNFELSASKPQHISVLFTPSTTPETYLELEGYSHPTPQKGEDEFSQNLLGGMLSPFGRVQTNLEIPVPPILIDIWFSPAKNITIDSQELGMLGKMAKTDCVIVPFEHQLTPEDVRRSMQKLFRLHAEFPRLMNLEGISDDELEGILPRLWVIAPSVEDNLLDGYRATQNKAWPDGVYSLGTAFLTEIIVIDKLPQNLDTMWLRILGSEEIRKKAINEVISLPEDQRRKSVLELLTTWKQTEV